MELNYNYAASLFQKARDKSVGKKLENNTRLIKVGDSYAVKFHNTNVVTINPDGSFTYDSGGWRTMSTKQRMEDYSPARIHSDKGVWYIAGQPFADGCVWENGSIRGAANDSDVKAEKELRKAIGQYAKDYITALYKGEIHAPDGGDCWLCTGKVSGMSHIPEHVTDKYYVPTLLLNALTAMGASIADKHDAAYLMKMAGWEQASGTFGKTDDPNCFIRKQLTRTLRRYCLQQCGMSY